MSLEVFGGGDEPDWFEILSNHGWITNDDGKTWRKYSDEEAHTMEEAIEAYESWREDY